MITEGENHGMKPVLDQFLSTLLVAAILGGIVWAMLWFTGWL